MKRYGDEALGVEHGAGGVCGKPGHGVYSGNRCPVCAGVEEPLFPLAEHMEPAVVMLTRAEADAICEVLIGMAVRLPLKHRNHAEALALLEWTVA